MPEPSLAERGRTLAAIGRVGSLSTQSRKLPGFPFGSMMPFAVDHLGRPIFFISTMAMHTQNLQQDGRASLLITQPDVSGDPLASARLTLVGTAAVAPADEVRDLYLSRYENARYWQEYTDFAYYRLAVEGVYFIGGFGVMGWVAAEEYAAAAPDPLAEAGPGIIQHMNADHADALRRIVERDSGEAPDAPEHVGEGCFCLSARPDRLLEERIHIVDIEKDTTAGAAQRLRGPGGTAGHFVGEHDHRIADFDFRVTDLSVGSVHTHYFLRTECVLVKVEGPRGIVKSKIRRYRAISLGNRLCLTWHMSLLVFWITQSV